MKRPLLAVGLAVAGLAALAYAALVLPRLPPPADAGLLSVAETLRPFGAPKGVVFLLSDAGGYGLAETLAARRLALAGSLVVGVDTPATLAKGDTASSECAYFVADVEEVNQDLQRSLDLPRYLSPVIAGRGLGGTLALSLAAQSPDATIGHTIAVDPGEALPMTRELCSEAAHHKAADGSGWIYSLQKGPLPDPVDVYLSPAADAAGSAHAAAIAAEGFPISIVNSEASAAAALDRAAVATLKSEQGDGNRLADLPLTPLPAVASHDTLAIILSGDGGWRDIDAEIGGALAKAGVPVVGVDSLRYFWHERTPDETAADIARIVAVYGPKWQAHKVALIGFSFGADVLPSVYAALPEKVRGEVSLLSLLSYSGEKAFEIAVSGILGAAPDTAGPSTIPDLEQHVPAGIVQCIYGIDDDENRCQAVRLPGAERVALPGGHHFDDDYETVSRTILKRIAG